MGRTLLTLLLCLSFGVILVSSNCDVDNEKSENAFFEQVKGVWYELFSKPESFAQEYRCRIEDVIQECNGLIEATMTYISGRDGKQIKVPGTIRKVGDLQFNFSYPDLEDWSGIYKAFELDVTSFSFYENKPQGGKGVAFTGIFFRDPKPDAATLDAVKKAVQEAGMNFDDFYSTCPE